MAGRINLELIKPVHQISINAILPPRVKGFSLLTMPFIKFFTLTMVAAVFRFVWFQNTTKSQEEGEICIYPLMQHSRSPRLFTG